MFGANYFGSSYFGKINGFVQVAVTSVFGFFSRIGQIFIAK